MSNSPVLATFTAAVLLSLTAGCDFINSLTGGGGAEEPVVESVPAEQAPQAASPAAEAPPVSSATPFSDAVNKATSAAQLTQTAQTAEEWQTVATDWQAAIALMQAVPEGDPNYAVAQQKVAEYQKNLEYAQQNAQG
jgi:methionine-rich copper-binding protein CopC